MLKRIKPKAEYSLVIEGKEIKGNTPSVTVRQIIEEIEPILYPHKKPRIKPKADYSVQTNE